MKKLILTILLSSSLFANIVEESLFILDPHQVHLDFFKSQTELTIDHLDHDGYELYGPKGTMKWLKDIDVDFTELIEVDILYRSYPSSEEINKQIREIVANNSHIFKLINIGQSENGEDLLFIKVSDNPHRDEYEPEVKLMANMHGNEIMGREILLQLLEDIAINYNKDHELTDLVNHTEIFIMPTMNPDGADRKRRGNANYVDLNRSFPDFTRPNDFKSPPSEVKAVMDFQRSRNFALSFNYHGGAVVVNYPWDTHHELHPEDNLIVSLSKEYVQNTSYFLRKSRFKDAITNGYKWYEVNGGMQDWSYHWYNDLQVTIEVSKNKWPRYDEREYFYSENKEAILNFIRYAHQGIGIRLKEDGVIKITQEGHFIGEYETRNREFYKVLLPGTYQFEFKNKDNSKSMEINISNKDFKGYIDF